MDDETELAEEEETEHFWQDYRWLIGAAALVAAVAFALFAFSAYQQAGDTAASLRATNANRETLERLDDAVSAISQNQKGIDELVVFIHNIQSTSQPGAAQAAVLALEKFLCESDGAVRGSPSCLDILGQ